MVEIVNLREARKRRKRAENTRAADENRARFGRSKAQAKLEAAQRAIDARRHDAHQRGEDDDG